MPARYQVPKRRVPVRIRGNDGSEEQVHLFLSELAENHPGGERPGDVFNGPSEFVVVETEGGEIWLLRRSNVAVVIVAGEHEYGDELAGADPLAADLDTVVDVKIELDDGALLEGAIRYQMPEAQNRLQDFMNASPPFLALYQESSVLLVNARRIARVMPL